MRVSAGSSTFLPYYDSILSESEKAELGKAKLNDTIADRVRTDVLGSVMESTQTGGKPGDKTAKRSKEHDHALIKFIPNKSDNSEILSDL